VLWYKVSTRDGLWRSLVSALDWGSRGPGFKSRQPDRVNAGHDFILTAGQGRECILTAKLTAKLETIVPWITFRGTAVRYPSPRERYVSGGSVSV
jgi:hypothetical protein